MINKVDVGWSHVMSSMLDLLEVMLMLLHGFMIQLLYIMYLIHEVQ